NSWAWHPSRDQFFWIQDHRLWTVDLASHQHATQRLAPTLDDITLGPLAFSRDGKFVVVGIHPFQVDDFHNAYPAALAIIPLDGSAPRTFDMPAGLHVKHL